MKWRMLRMVGPSVTKLCDQSAFAYGVDPPRKNSAELPSIEGEERPVRLQ